ncbi:hypothetical protein P280DRAFT_538382 [Massarina eburnea CBS 473.64]|uniref:Heme haloperoxidase family profile domain-containing protein n=1 Tax=Massarina eburnea CBS 473.64 TaxID=1395130 RepID=A0A6A6RL02_9PLEO|nr:hypothetical protein P280DRAFT_538382 [Massarina eburnea CBS 473.64]
MKINQAALLALPALSSAFPGMGGVASKAETEKFIRRQYEAENLEKRQTLTTLTGTIAALASTVTGLLGSVASSVDPSNLRPERDFTYQAPASTDSRGPCPGLNLLANYNYLPRNGHVTFGQVINATSRGFNMGADLATVLLVFAILTDGDIATESFYLGSLNGVGGLNRHSTVEADVSPNREDYYLGCGDNHHVSSRLFAQNVGYAYLSSSKQFDLGTMGNQYAASASFSKKYNPYLYYFPFPQIVSLGAFAFYPNFFSNGTYGAGGVANYESISSIIGAKFIKSTGQFQYVPEQWPAYWYRRATPYGAVQALTDALVSIYPKNIIVPLASQAGTPNLSARDLLCDIYQGINSITPLGLAGALGATAEGVTWALSKLTPVIGAGTTLGCPLSTLSPNENTFFTNASSTGGPGKNPASSTAHTGNNVYNKVYFPVAPVVPTC